MMLMLFWWMLSSQYCPNCITGAVPVQDGDSWSWMCAPHAITAVTHAKLPTHLDVMQLWEYELG